MKFYKDHFCHCGCNKPIPYSKYHKYTGIPLYIQGHGSRKHPLPKEEIKILENDILVYKDYFCECPCHQRIPWANWHKWNSIPKFIKGHNSIKNFELYKNVSDAETIIKNNIKVYRDYCCHCGCGNNIPFNNIHTATGIPTYICGHSSRIYPIPDVIIENGIKVYKDYYCKCECGSKINFKENHQYNGIPDFIEGHQSRGEFNPNWDGGKSFLPYCSKFNSKLKESVRIRDNYICQLCGKTQEEELLKSHKILSIHHIHFDKENCYPDLITLCSSCNSIVNFKKESSEYEFMMNLEKRGLLGWKPDYCINVIRKENI